MKIIDEKGRLFGKINVIDFLVILFLLSLTPMFYFGYKIHSKKASVQEEQVQPQKPKEGFITITINCKFIKLKPEVVRMISVRDKELDNDGNLMGQILSVGKPSPYICEFYVGPDQKLIEKDPKLQQMAVTLKINPLIRGENIYYKNKQILEGGALEFSSGKYSVTAEGVTIVKDKDSAVIDTRVQDVGVVNEAQFDTVKKELDTLKKELNNLKAGKNKKKWLW